MTKRRKRAPGAGRKPDPNKKVMFSTRLEPEVMTALKAAAQGWPGKNVSTFTEYLISRGLRERDEARRDPALRGLLFLIAALAERLSGATGEQDKGLRLKLMMRWRQDLHAFRAFKLAVHKLIDALEEPPESTLLTDEQIEESARKTVEETRPSDPEKTRKLLIELSTSPEALGSRLFERLWEFGHLDPVSQKDVLHYIRMADQQVAEFYEQEFLTISRAWKAVNKIDTATEKPEEKGRTDKDDRR